MDKLYTWTATNEESSEVDRALCLGITLEGGELVLLICLGLVIAIQSIVRILLEPF